MKKIIFVLMLVLIAGNLSAQGLTRHGEITNSSTVFIDKNGKIGNTPALNQSGAVATGIALTSIAAISGTPNVGVELSAGALSPSGGTATYQWTICSTVDGTYTNISGATSNNYTTDEADLGRFIKVVATGSAGYTGTVTSAATSSVSLSIGDSYGGGKVAYILQSGDPGYDANITKGLIVANSDQSTGAIWSLPPNQTTSVGTTGSALGTGLANTNLIITQNGAGSYAASIARACSDGGYTDWYLPSQDELAKLYAMKVLGFGGFGTSPYYWSSTEDNTRPAYAWDQNFVSGGTQASVTKSGTHYVRAVRSFAILPSVTINTQVWASRNLDVTTYRDGTTIPQVTDQTEWAALTSGAWCYYENNSANGTTYGKLYNWYAVNDARGLAPTGWHVATNDEWTSLSTFLGSEPGMQLKEAGTTHWPSPNTGATNAYGFTALPGGYRNGSGTFINVNSNGYCWSSTSQSTDHAWDREVQNSNSNLSNYGIGLKAGMSVRCVQD